MNNRLTRSYQYTSSSLLGLKTSFYPKIDIFGHTINFENSLTLTNRVPIQHLRSFSRSIPARKAIRRVTNGVLAMPWAIKQEDALKSNPTPLIKNLTKALKRPNREEHNTYIKFCQAIIEDIITLGFAAVERQEGEESTQPFWLWAVNPENIYLNPLWHPGEDDVPKYYQRTIQQINGIPEQTAAGARQQVFVPIYSQNMFLITFSSNTYEMIPPGPLEIAYEMISSWLGLSRFQFNTTSNAVREYLLVLKNITKEELLAFRQYWKTDVLGQGDIPIIGAEGSEGNFDVDVVKLGAKNDDELYLKYTEYILKIIALAFDLANRDFGITEHDNRATSGFAADSTFADAVLPMAINLRESFSYEVVDNYAPGHYFEYIDTEPRNQKDEADTANTLYSGGIIKLNEARQRVNEEPLDDGDKLIEKPTTPNSSSPPQKDI